MMNLFRKIFDINPKIIIIFICIFFIFSWFRYGQIYGGGDIGLPLYNPKVSESLTRYTWWETQGTGLSYPGVFSSYPFYFIFSLFQRIGFTPLMSQIIFFLSILLASGLGMYAFSYYLSKNKTISFFVSLFYLINPYTMMSIWHRFAHTSMLFMAFLPISLLFLSKGLKNKDLKFAFYLAFISIFGGYSFGTPAFLGTWFFLIISFWFAYSFQRRFWKFKKFSFYFLLTFFIAWIGFNLWWILPFFDNAKEVLFISSSSVGNIENLRGVSRYFKVPFAFRGINAFYLFEQKDWGDIFANIPFRILSWFGFFVILLTFLSKKKPYYFLYFAFLFLISIFISKGSEEPFGEIIVISFNLFPSLGVFRNPFEKFGILMPFSGAYLFGYGIHYFLGIVKTSKRKNLLYTSLTVFFIGFFVVFHWPLWLGKVFGNMQHSALVKVPEEYEEASKWFSYNADDTSRILHLPLALGDGISYKWEYGYSGLEISQLFFPRSSISHYIGYPLIDEKYKKIAMSVKEGNWQVFENLLSSFGVNYIVLHKDVDFNSYLWDSLENIENFLDSLPYLKKEKEFGYLVIYSINIKNNERIVLVDNPVLISGNISISDDNLLLDNGSRVNLYLNNTADERLLNSRFYLFPEFIINYPITTVSKENAIRELPYVRFIPGQPPYPLIRLKEKLIFLLQNEEERFYNSIVLSGKRLVETDALLDKRNYMRAEKALDYYKKHMELVFPEIMQRVKKLSGMGKIEEIEMFQILLLRQREALEFHIVPKTPPALKEKVYSVIRFLNENMSNSGLIRVFPVDGNDLTTTFKFNVYKDGNYTLRLKRGAWSDIIRNNVTVPIFVNGIKQNTGLEETEKYLNIGPVLLNKGYQEITLERKPVNLLREGGYLVYNPSLFNVSTESNKVYRMFAVDEKNFLEYRLEDIDSDSVYKVSFDYFVEYGRPPKLEVFQSRDLVSDEKKASLEKQGEIGRYYYGWRNLDVNFQMDGFSDELIIRISLEPWNKCDNIYYRQKNKCKNPAFSKNFNRRSEVELKNISVTKFPTRGAALFSQRLENDNYSLLNLSFRKINPTKYKVNLDKNQGILVFRETYYKGWILRSEGRDLNFPHFLVDGYANGWLIDKEIDDLSIEFESQRKRTSGLIIGIVFLFVGLLLIKLRIYAKLY